MIPIRKETRKPVLSYLPERLACAKLPDPQKLAKTLSSRPNGFANLDEMPKLNKMSYIAKWRMIGLLTKRGDVVILDDQ